ncbi:MAG: mce [Dehalococcoidales bacterium]|nr:mce [Dehalococcoidales bacterium]
MITKVDHIGIAVSSIDNAVKLYTEVLGLKLKNIEILVDQKIKTAIITVGDTKIELLESTDPDGVIAKFIESRGEGLHHIAFEVDNIQDALGTMVKKGVSLIDSKPRKGAENLDIAFLHPRSTGRVLMELVET